MYDSCELQNVYGRGTYATVQCELERPLLNWYLQTADVTPFNEDPRGLPS